MDSTIPGRTEWESRQYLLDHGHRVAVAQAHRYIASQIEADENYPLPDGSDALVAEAAAALARRLAIRDAAAETLASIRGAA